MRRTMLTLIGLVLLSASGCIGVSSETHNTSELVAGDSEVAVVGGRVYVVSKTTGRAKVVDLSAATPYKTEEEGAADDDE